ncbi:kinase-like domain-containing protein [Dendryphion nanum]|uniref:Kinase-like domain-containing protein n=1 Tax=Dendryphion nanum TaxID=256645 RepID=A0A9P9EK67_9PLEO|nr:kinase-like domain-containing protein [Dendryphion nanum]
MSDWRWDSAKKRYYYIHPSSHQYIYDSGERIKFKALSAPAAPNYLVINSREAFTSSDEGQQAHASPTILPESLCPTDFSLVEGRYKIIKNLDRGGQTLEKGIREVHDVRNRNAIYALKTYVCKDLEQYRERGFNFNHEVSIMARLHHSAHVVKLIRCHSNPQTLEFSFVMSPVANQGNLTNYMLRQFQLPNTLILTERFMQIALADLAKGLEDIHEHSVRHKDIKPGNILVHNDRVLYTDFGLSLDYRAFPSDITNCTHPEHDCTPAYAAPETHAHTPRNRKSDVFCLGLVYLELLCTRAVVLTGNTDWGNDTIFGKYFQRYSDMVASGRVGRTLDWIEHKEKVVSLRKYVPLVRSMLDLERDHRPSAEKLVRELGISMAKKQID